MHKNTRYIGLRDTLTKSTRLLHSGGSWRADVHWVSHNSIGDPLALQALFQTRVGPSLSNVTAQATGKNHVVYAFLMHVVILHLVGYSR